MRAKSNLLSVGLAVAVMAMILFLIIFSRPGPPPITVQFVGMTNGTIGFTNATWAMYVVSNQSTKTFGLIGTKLLFKTNDAWVLDPNSKPTEIGWWTTAATRVCWDFSGTFVGGGTFHLFVAQLPDATPRKAYLGFMENRVTSVSVRSPSLLEGIVEEAQTKLDRALHPNVECVVPEPVR